LAKHTCDVSLALLWYFGKLAISKKKVVSSTVEAASHKKVFSVGISKHRRCRI